MSLAHKDILIIDDDREIRVLMKRIIDAAGANCIEQDNVEGGIDYAMASPPHLILLDLKMPKHSGFDFLKVRNKSQALQTIPVLVVSGSRDKDSVYKALSLGAADYIVKPLETKTLLQKIRKYLKDHAFYSYRFPEDEQPEAELSFKGHITKVNKTHFSLEAPVKILPHSQMRIQSRFLKMIDADDQTFKTSMRPPFYLEDRTYLNTVQFLGVDEESIQKIQELMKKAG